jgi:hypothetical protein
MSHVLPALTLTEHQVVRVLASEARPLSPGQVRRCCSWVVRPRVGSALSSLVARGVAVREGAFPPRYAAADEWWVAAQRPRTAA